MTAVVEPRANYVQTTWVDDSPPGTGTPLNAANMNKLEGGIGAALPMQSVFTAPTIAYQNKLLAGDAQPAFYISGAGVLAWGSGGATAPDSNFGRIGGSVIGTSQELRGGVINVTADGNKYYFGPSYDTNLYRSAAGVLQSDGAIVSGGTALKRIELSVDRLGGGQAAINFGGPTPDTNLYRAAAGVLKTDGSFAHLGYGTSLPASPVDGQVYTLVDSVTNPSYQWTFRYNAGSSSAYKWEFVGGGYAIAKVDSDNNFVADTTWHGAGGTAGPSFTVPRAGDYEYEAGANLYHTTTAGDFYFGISVAAANPVAPNQWSASLAINKAQTGGLFGQLLGLAASTALVVYYNVGFSSGTQANCRWRVLKVRPVRVS